MTALQLVFLPFYHFKNSCTPCQDHKEISRIWSFSHDQKCFQIIHGCNSMVRLSPNWTLLCFQLQTTEHCFNLHTTNFGGTTVMKKFFTLFGFASRVLNEKFSRSCTHCLKILIHSSEIWQTFDLLQFI